MRGIRIVSLALVLVLLAPAAAAAPAARDVVRVDRDGPDVTETEVGGQIYIVVSNGKVEIWKESNGKAGLQKTADFDENNQYYEADTKVASVP